LIFGGCYGFIYFERAARVTVNDICRHGLKIRSTTVSLFMSFSLGVQG
jgi:hypothetical protein